MSIASVTPFRQLARAYGALLGINDSLRALQSSVGDLQNRDGNRTVAAETAQLRERIAALENTFDARVSEVLRRHIFLPSPELHWQQDRPFMPYSSCSAADFLHPRYSEICKVIDHPLQFHRKVWEWIFVYHHLEQSGALAAGKRGLGFGVGQERMPSVFANRGVTVVATDAPPAIGVSSGWSASGQHSESLAQLYYPNIVPEALFKTHVSHQFCDMNAIGDSLVDFDFTWSCCCYEHLGTIEAGEAFVINSVEKTLKSGGIAVHTTELNLSSNDDTVEEGHTVLFRRCDFERLVARLRALGHEVQPFVVAPDSHVLDFHVDLPPYGGEPHLKLRLENYVTTSAGIVVRKK